MADREFADVSVVMPAYNAAATIGRALASIAAQTLPPREVIVVDDGSTDATLAEVKAMAPHMNGIRLRLFTQANQGPGAARNRCIRAASGAWLAFLDSDDEWLPAKLERSMAVMAADPGLVMSSHDIIEITKDGETRVDCRARFLANPRDPFRTLFLRGFISSSTVLVRRDAVVAVGGFDARLRSSQDYELWLAVLARPGARMVTFGEALLRYYLFDGGITSKTDERMRCNLAIVRNHLGDLRASPGPVLKPLVLRVLICHLEAVRAHRARGRRSAAVRAALTAPLSLMRMLAALGSPQPARPDFLARLDADVEVALGN